MPFPSSEIYPSEGLYPGSTPPKSEGFGDSEFPVVITDEFSYPNGRWFHYYAPPVLQRGAVRNQRHVNIRSFVSERRSIHVSMFVMDQFDMYALDGETIAHFTQDTAKALVYAESDESWTYGTVKRQSDRNNWNGITVPCKANTETITQSVIPV
jgi:hypothetical protein